jgi:type 1 glutamine amidotransferase
MHALKAAALLCALLSLAGDAAAARPRKVVLIAGPLDKGHPRGTHEYEKSVRLLAHCLRSAPALGVRCEAYLGGWPDEPAALDDADCIVLVASGSDRKVTDHPFLVGDRLAAVEKQMKRGCGLVLLHWCVFVPRAGAGEKFLDWVGGYFDYESGPRPQGWYSKIQTATTKAVPVSASTHPAGRGLVPFQLREEYYYRIRFRERDRRLTPVLTTVLPGEAGAQTVAWAVERPGGGRGFAFTGGHFFDNWKIDNFRKLVLNAVAWAAHAEVPAAGVPSAMPTEAELARVRLGKEISTLILTGHDGPFHDWRATSRALREVLQQDPRFRVRVVEDPEYLARADLAAYDLVVQNYVNWQKPGLSEKAKANLLAYLRSGKGLAVVHFANGAFHFSLPGAKASDWPEYRKIVRRVWDHTGKSGHDPYGPFRVSIAPARHPITEGMRDFSTTDELYFRQAGEEPITPLVTARSKLTGKDEPLAWAGAYGKARVFQTLLGHSAASVRAAGLLLRRGCVWAAGRAQAALPAGQPAAPPAVRLAPGKFGKALDAAATPLAFAGDERYRTPPLTVECWARLNSRRGFNVLVSSDPKSSARHWEVYSYAGSGAFSAYLPGYAPAEVVSKTNICDGKWHFLAMTFDGKQVALYVDGRQAHRQAVAPRPGLKPAPGPLSFGQAIDGSGRVGCDGLIDDVRLSRVVRKPAVPARPLPVDAQTVGVWRFDSASEAVLADPAWTPPPAARGEAWERATDVDWVDGRLRQMDTGPTFNATLRYPHAGATSTVYKATAVRVGAGGRGAVVFDRCGLRLAAGWTGGFLRHSDARFGLLNTPRPAGTMAFSTAGGPGWADPEGRWEGKNPPTAPLPQAWGRYLGMHLHRDRVVFSYLVGKVLVRESPWLESAAGQDVFVRTLEVGPGKADLHLLAGELPGPGRLVRVAGAVLAVSRQGDGASAVILVGGKGAELSLAGRRAVVRLGPSGASRKVRVLLWRGPAGALGGVGKAAKALPAGDLSALLKAGPPRWTKPIVTRGERGGDGGPYAVDTLTVPYQNPHKALFFLTGVDFLPGGDLAVCTAHGDVWLVKGVDAGLKKLTWKRFATGLYQPLGLKVVGGKVVVLERGQLTRLSDLDGDGEADLYENLCDDWHTGGGEHSYDTCLETGPDGSFYFFKTGDTQLPTGGCLLRVPRGGGRAEVFATGFRHPIGLSCSADGVLTGADQEGNWMPATRIDLYRKGGFYGDMRAHHRATPPKTYDPPLLWLPKVADNSAGGQVWVPHDRFGLPRGQLLHLSYGRCKLFAVLRQRVGDVEQAGAVDLGLFFLSGAMRGRFHPTDGALYVAGLNGWQTAARRDGCLQRVRYTGKPLTVPTGLGVHANGIRLSFASPLDAKTAADRSRYQVEQWNYRWSGDYGSRHWSVRQPGRVGQDRLSVSSAVLAKDGKSVFLEVKGMTPVMQMRVGYDVRAAGGGQLVGAVYNTVHRLAAEKR